MEDENSFKCNFCKNAYKYEGTLKTHVMVEHCKSNTYNCDQCEHHRSSIAADVRDQTYKDPTNKCNQCIDYESYEEGHLKTHLKTHSGKESKKCSQCDFVCSDPSSLRRHMKSHKPV